MVPSNSCMVQSQPPGPVNKGHGSITGLGSLGPSCQRMKAPESQSSSQASCYFQRNPNPGGPAAETSAGPQEDTAINPLSCQLTPGLPTDSLLSQQHYLNCIPHTQVTARTHRTHTEGHMLSGYVHTASLDAQFPLIH